MPTSVASAAVRSTCAPTAACTGAGSVGRTVTAFSDQLSTLAILHCALEWMMQLLCRLPMLGVRTCRRACTTMPRPRPSCATQREKLGPRVGGRSFLTHCIFDSQSSHRHGKTPDPSVGRGGGGGDTYVGARGGGRWGCGEGMLLLPLLVVVAVGLLAWGRWISACTVVGLRSGALLVGATGILPSSSRSQWCAVVCGWTVKTVPRVGTPLRTACHGGTPWSVWSASPPPRTRLYLEKDNLRACTTCTACPMVGVEWGVRMCFGRVGGYLRQCVGFLQPLYLCLERCVDLL